MIGRRTFAYICACFVSTAVMACNELNLLDGFVTDGVAPAGAHCTQYLAESGAEGVVCQWDFPYRGPTAILLANRLRKQIHACRRINAVLVDTPVNHPDSYNLRRWITQEATYSLSTKDKSRSQSTFVFLRRQPRQR